MSGCAMCDSSDEGEGTSSDGMGDGDVSSDDADVDTSSDMNGDTSSDGMGDTSDTDGEDDSDGMDDVSTTTNTDVMLEEGDEIEQIVDDEEEDLVFAGLKDEAVRLINRLEDEWSENRTHGGYLLDTNSDSCTKVASYTDFWQSWSSINPMTLDFDEMEFLKSYDLPLILAEMDWWDQYWSSDILTRQSNVYKLFVELKHSLEDIRDHV